MPRVVSSSERIFSPKRGNHEKENRWSCAWCSAGVQHVDWRLGTGRRRWRRSRRSGKGVLRVQVPVEIQLVVLLEGEVHLMPHRRI